jgi:hypothetical protein
MTESTPAKPWKSVVLALSIFQLSLMANAAVYDMKITSGSAYSGLPFGDITTDLTGKPIQFHVTDEFEAFSVCVRDDCTPGLYKTLDFTNGNAFPGLFGPLYSTDGTHFSVFYFGSGGRSTTVELTLAGASASYAMDSYDGSFTHFVAAVPAPAAAWLFGSGLLALAGAARRKYSAA